MKNLFGGPKLDSAASTRVVTSGSSTALTEIQLNERLGMARKLVGSGDVSGAIDELLYVHERNSENIETNGLLGSLLLAVQQYDLAEDFLFAACELSKWTEPSLVSNLAIALKEKGDLSMSMKILTKGLETAGSQDKTGLLSVSIGDVQYAAQNYSSAADWYLVAAMKQPTNVELWVSASTVKFPAHGRDAKFGENVLLRALELNPDNAEIVYNLGLLMHLNDRLEESIVFYRESLRLADDNVAAVSALATALHATGQLNDALPLYQSALAKDSDNVVLLSNFALLLSSLRQPAEGLKFSKRAIELDPTSNDAVRAHAECLASSQV